MEKCSIYGLCDPRTPDDIRVVGKTTNRLIVRMRQYAGDARHRRKLGRNLPPSYAWILSLLDQGFPPQIRLLETCSAKYWKKRERRLITLYRNRGHKLFNIRDGGDGPDTGKIKIFCDVCGTRRRRLPSGGRYCPKCRGKRNGEWARKNKEQVNSRLRSWYQQDIERSRARGRKHGAKYYAANRKKAIAATRRWQRKRGKPLIMASLQV
jgi:hypothetical protein